MAAKPQSNDSPPFSERPHPEKDGGRFAARQVVILPPAATSSRAARSLMVME